MFVSALLTLVGLGIFAYKAAVLGFPLLPEAETKVWTVQARSASRPAAAGQGGAADTHRAAGLLDPRREFVSRGYGLTLGEQDEAGGREARWRSARRAAANPLLPGRRLRRRSGRLSDAPRRRRRRCWWSRSRLPSMPGGGGAAGVGRHRRLHRRRAAPAGAGRTGRERELLRPGRGAAAGRSWRYSCSPPSACRRGSPMACLSRSGAAGPLPALARGLRRGSLAGLRSDHRRRGLAQDYLVWWRGLRPLIQVQARQRRCRGLGPVRGGCHGDRRAACRAAGIAAGGAPVRPADRSPRRSTGCWC